MYTRVMNDIQLLAQELLNSIPFVTVFTNDFFFLFLLFFLLSMLLVWILRKLILGPKVRNEPFFSVPIILLALGLFWVIASCWFAAGFRGSM